MKITLKIVRYKLNLYIKSENLKILEFWSFRILESSNSLNSCSKLKAPAFCKNYTINYKYFFLIYTIYIKLYFVIKVMI